LLFFHAPHPTRFLPPPERLPIFYCNNIPYTRDQARSRPAYPEEVKELVWKHPSSNFKREEEKVKIEKIRHYAELEKKLLDPEYQDLQKNLDLLRGGK
jgi:hypothetical protein